MHGPALAPADGERRALDAVDPEELEPETGADHVHDRVHGADLVEVDLVGARAVDLGLGRGEPLEDAPRARARPRREVARVDRGEDLGEVALVPVRVLPESHEDARRGDRSSLLLAGRDLEAFDAERAEAVPQLAQRGARVHERPEHHVARAAAHEVEIGRAHGAILASPGA